MLPHTCGIAINITTVSSNRYVKNVAKLTPQQRGWQLGNTNARIHTHTYTHQPQCGALQHFLASTTSTANTSPDCQDIEYATTWVSWLTDACTDRRSKKQYAEFVWRRLESKKCGKHNEDETHALITCYTYLNSCCYCCLCVCSILPLRVSC